MKKNLFTPRKVAFLGVLAALFLAGCIPTPPPTVDKGPIKIGVIAPLTGDGAAYGTIQRNIITMVVENINKAGGINGRTIDLDVEDGQCNGKDATTAAQKLINVTKVQAILGGLCSSETLGIAPVAEAAKVLVISGGSSSPAISKAGEYIFRTYPSDSGKGKVLAEYAVKKGFKKVGVIAEQTDYALGIKDVFVNTLKEKGQEAVVELFTSESSDFRTQLTKLKSAGVDVLFINPQTSNKGLLILQQMQELKFTPKLITQEVLGTDTETLKKAGQFVEGMITADVVAPDTDAFKKFKTDYKAKYDKDLNFESIAAGVYDSVTVLAQAIKEVGYDATKMKDYLAKLKDFKGLIGTFSFDENGDPTLTHVLLVIKDSKPVPYVEEEEKK